MGNAKLRGRILMENIKVTLCRKCHYQFHKDFGFRNNNEEQIMEYLLENEMLSCAEEE